jgi:hypothetical protein
METLCYYYYYFSLPMRVFLIKVNWGKVWKKGEAINGTLNERRSGGQAMTWQEKNGMTTVKGTAHTRTWGDGGGRKAGSRLIVLQMDISS